MPISCQTHFSFYLHLHVFFMYVNNEDNILSMHLQRLACLLVPRQCDIAKNLSLAQVVLYLYTL